MSVLADIAAFEDHARAVAAAHPDVIAAPTPLRRDEPGSWALAGRIPGYRGCFQNALDALRLLPDARYVEGWAISGGHLNRHAFLVHEGKILDPSRAFLKASTGYFPGLVLSGVEAVQWGRGRSPPFMRYGEVERQPSPQFVAACRAWAT